MEEEAYVPAPSFPSSSSSSSSSYHYPPTEAEVGVIADGSYYYSPTEAEAGVIVDESPLIVESFDETVFPDEEELQEDVNDENSLIVLKTNMDRILERVGIQPDPSPATLQYSLYQPEPTADTSIAAIQASNFELPAGSIFEPLPAGEMATADPIPMSLSVELPFGVTNSDPPLGVMETLGMIESTPLPIGATDPIQVNSIPELVPEKASDMLHVPGIGMLPGHMIQLDVSEFEPEIVPGQLENADRHDSYRKGRRKGKKEDEGEYQDFYPIPRTAEERTVVYEPPTMYGTPLPGSAKLLHSITFGSMVSEAHAIEQLLPVVSPPKPKPKPKSDKKAEKERREREKQLEKERKKKEKEQEKLKAAWSNYGKHKGRSRTLPPCPPMEALQQEFALGNVEFSVTGGSIAILANNGTNHGSKRKRKACIHGREKGKCKECGYCIHQRYRYTCIDCNGPGICEHKRRRAECKECKGGSVCKHNRIRRRCNDCSGNAKCEHNRLKGQCKECYGSSICPHKKSKHSCKICKNEQMRMNAAAVLLELPGLDHNKPDEEKVDDDDEFPLKLRVGYNGMSNAPTIGNVIGTNVPMEDGGVSDYSYRSGDFSYPQTVEVEETEEETSSSPNPEPEIVIDANGNEINIAKSADYNPGIYPSFLPINVTDQGNHTSVDPYAYMNPDTMMPLPAHTNENSDPASTNVSDYGYLNDASQGSDSYGVVQQRQQQQQQDFSPAYFTNFSNIHTPNEYMENLQADYVQSTVQNTEGMNDQWMSMMPLDAGVNNGDDGNNGIMIDGASITIISNTEEGRVN